MKACYFNTAKTKLLCYNTITGDSWNERTFILTYSILPYVKKYVCSVNNMSFYSKHDTNLAQIKNLTHTISYVGLLAFSQCIVRCNVFALLDSAQIIQSSNSQMWNCRQYI